MLKLVAPLSLAAFMIRNYRKSFEPQFPIVQWGTTPAREENKKKILVVGAGIIGCNIVYHLVKHTDPQSSQIQIIDPCNGVCKGASEQNGRHVNFNLGHNYSMSYFKRLEEIMKQPEEKSIGLNPLAFFQTGGLRFFTRQYHIQQSKEALVRIVRTQAALAGRSHNSFWSVMKDLEQELGSDILKTIKVRDTTDAKSYPHDKVPEALKSQGYKICEGEEAKAFCQAQGTLYVKEDRTTILKSENAKTVETNQLGQAFLQFAQAKSKNLQVRTNVKMTSWISDTEGKILGVNTNQGPIFADTIILAAGVPTKFMVAPLGLILPLIAGKGYSINYTEKEGGAKLPPLDCNFCDSTSSLYYNKTPGQFRQSGIFEVTTFDDLQIDQSKIKRMHKYMKITFNADVMNFDQKKWTQHRPCLPQDLPVVGRVPNYSNVYIATGTGTKGTMLSNPVAELLVAEVTGKGDSVSPIYSELGDSIKPQKYLSFY